MSSFGRSQNASTIQLPEIELQTCRGTSSWEAKVMALGPRLLGGTFQSQPPWIASTLNNLIYHPFVSWKFPKFPWIFHFPGTKLGVRWTENAVGFHSFSYRCSLGLLAVWPSLRRLKGSAWNSKRSLERYPGQPGDFWRLSSHLDHHQKTTRKIMQNCHKIQWNEPKLL